MTSRSVAPYVLIALLLTAPVRADTADETTEIYTILLARFASTGRPDAPIYVMLSPRTVPVEEGYSAVGWVPEPVADDLTWRSPKASRRAIVDLLSKSGQTQEVTYKPFPASLPLRVLPAAQAAPAGARAFVVSFSRIGFDAKTRQALVFASTTCPGLCGAGELILLTRGKAGWRITAVHRFWVS